MLDSASAQQPPTESEGPDRVLVTGIGTSCSITPPSGAVWQPNPVIVLVSGLVALAVMLVRWVRTLIFNLFAFKTQVADYML